MPENVGNVFMTKYDMIRIGIYFHGDEAFAEEFRHDLAKRDDTARVMTRATKHYDGEVETFNEVYVTPAAQKFCPNHVDLLVEAYGKAKIKVVLLKEKTEPPKAAPEVKAEDEKPAKQQKAEQK